MRIDFSAEYMYLFSLVYSILQKERRYENDNWGLYRKYSYKSYDIIRKNQCADLLLFCVDILINNSENNNYEKDLNHIISEILLLMKNSPERCTFLLKAGMDNKRTKYETNDYKSSKLYFQWWVYKWLFNPIWRKWNDIDID